MATVGVVEAKAAAMEAVAEVANMVAAAKAVNATGVAQPQLDGGRRLERPVRRKMPHINAQPELVVVLHISGRQGR